MVETPAPGRADAVSTRRLLFAGDDVGRVLALSDGVFAFAMTLLVLSLAVGLNPFPMGTPENVEGSVLAGALNTQTLPSLLIYAVAFFIIGSWWMGHQELFHRIRGYDRGLLLLNLSFLILIAITPFTLGVLAKYGYNYASIGWFAGLELITGLTMAGLCYYAMSDRRLYNAQASGLPLTIYADRALVTSAVFGVSIALGFFVPEYAVLSWIAIFPIQLTVLRRLRVAAPRPPGADPPAPPAS